MKFSGDKRVGVEDLARMVQNEFEETAERLARLGKRVVRLERQLHVIKRTLREHEQRISASSRAAE